MRKFSVYVDETGQDTEGKFFLVGVVITEVADEFGTILNSIEKDSGKASLKWHKANQSNRENYIRAVFKAAGVGVPTPAQKGQHLVGAGFETRPHRSPYFKPFSIVYQIRNGFDGNIILSSSPRYFRLCRMCSANHSRGH